MELYRKPNEYYADEYDRNTINQLKELEKQEKESLFFPPDKSVLKPQYKPFTKFYHTAVLRAQSRDADIAAMRDADELKDSLVGTHPIPENVRCNTCNSEMYFKDYMFRENNTQILFVFECPKNHIPNKALYPNRQEYFFPKRRCDDCGSELKSEFKEEKDKFIFSIICSGCGKITTDVLDKSPMDESIKAEDRKKYCLDFIGCQTFDQDLEKVVAFYDNDLVPFLEKEKMKEEYSLDEIEKVSVPQMEKRLVKLIEELGYIKFYFKDPILGERMKIPFSVQDPTQRDKIESVNILTKCLRKNLFNTNFLRFYPQFLHRRNAESQRY